MIKPDRTVITFLFSSGLLVMAGQLFTPALAQDKSPDAQKITWTAENSDPRVLKWMQGSPPPPDKIIRFADGSYFKFPQLRWSVCHFQQLMPTQAVSRGLSQSVPLPRNESAAIDLITGSVSET